MNNALSQSGEKTNLVIDQYLVFPLAEDNYGLNIAYIREIIEYVELTEVPLVPDFIRGVLNLRGRVVPVIDLQCRFSGDISSIGKKSCILIVEVDQKDGVLEMGVLVDAVTKVVDLAADDIEPAPNFGSKIRTDFIQGMGKINNTFVVLLQVDKVLSIDELSIIKNVQDNINKDIKVESETINSTNNDHKSE